MSVKMFIGVAVGVAALGYMVGGSWNSRLIEEKVKEPAIKSIVLEKVQEPEATGPEKTFTYLGQNKKWIKTPGGATRDYPEFVVNDGEDFVVYAGEPGTSKHMARKFYIKDKETFDKIKIGDKFLYDNRNMSVLDYSRTKRDTTEEEKVYGVRGKVIDRIHSGYGSQGHPITKTEKLFRKAKAISAEKDKEWSLEEKILFAKEMGIRISIPKGVGEIYFVGGIRDEYHITYKPAMENGKYPIARKSIGKFGSKELRKYLDKNKKTLGN